MHIKKLQLHPYPHCVFIVFTVSTFLGYTHGQSVDPTCLKSDLTCVCQSKSIIEYYTEAFHTTRAELMRAPDAIRDRVNNFACKSYVRLPQVLLIKMSDGELAPGSYAKRLRRYRQTRSLPPDERFTDRAQSRQRREVSLGHPTPQKFANVIAKIPKRSAHHYTPLGSESTLNCISSTDGVEEEFSNSKIKKYFWTRENGLPVTATATFTDSLTGDLTFKSVSLADTGIYNCNMTYEEDNEQKSQAFQSQLDVVAEPMLWLRFGMTYSVDRCRRQQLTLIENHIQAWVHTWICNFCPVRNVSVNCLKVHDDERTKYVQVQLAVSTIGMEKLIPALGQNSQVCPMDCVEKMHSKILNVVLVSLIKMFRLQIVVEPVDDKSTLYIPMPKTVDQDIALGCPSGFFENYKLCFPCAAGKYSPDGKTECFKCKEDFFQPNPGSSTCFPCPKGHITLDEGSVTQMDCIYEIVGATWNYVQFHWIIIGVFLGIIILVLALYFLIRCYYPDMDLWNLFCCICIYCKKTPDKRSSKLKRISLEKIIETTDGTDTDDMQVETTKESHLSTKKRLTNKLKRIKEKASDLSDQIYKPIKPIAKQVRNKVRGAMSQIYLPPLKRKDSYQNLHKRDIPEIVIEMTDDIESSSTSNLLETEHNQHVEPILELNHVPNYEKEVPSFPHRVPPVPCSDSPGRSCRRNKNASGSLRQKSPNFDKAKRGRDSAKPYMQLGTVINKSKSLMNKLKQQRHKLGERDKSPESSIKSALEKKFKPLAYIKNKNTFKNNRNVPCRDCTSSNFVLRR